MTTLRLTLAATLLLSSSAAIAQSEPVACTMDAKQCPDGSYVGRIGPDCRFAPCPGESSSSSAPSCAPYVCVDGTTHPSCTEDGHVINYFAPPCLTHGGDAGPFKDVPADHANANAIAYVRAENIVEGYADGTFKPDATINRAEFAKIITGATGDVERDASCKIAPFPDSVPGAWYAPYLQAARCRGIAGGYSDGTFRPAASINFVEAAKIVVKAFGLEASTTIPACEEDDCPWYRSYVLILEAHAAIPLSINAFDQNITRGEMAEIVWRVKAGRADLPSRTYEDMRTISSGMAQRYENVPSFYRVTYPARYVAFSKLNEAGNAVIPASSSDARVIIAPNDEMLYCCESLSVIIEAVDDRREPREWLEAYVRESVETPFGTVRSTVLGGVEAVEAVSSSGMLHRVVVLRRGAGLLVIKQNADDDELDAIVASWAPIR